MPRQTKVEKLYLELLEVEDELSYAKELYQRKEELLEQIFKLDDAKKEHVFEINGEDKSVKVVLQNGHYVFNRPFRLSVKKAA